MERPAILVPPSDDERALVRRILAHTNSLEAGYLETEAAIDVFNRSGLSRLQLREVWKHADADSNGRIAHDELTVAVRLMGWMQHGQQFSEALLEKPGPLPVLDGIAPPTPPQKDPALFPKAAFPPVMPVEIQEYSNIFHAGGSVEGLLDGEKVRDIFLRSNLAYRDLSSIWILLDTTRRGRLNFLEFALGMYLIKAIRSCHLNGVPPSIPPEVREEVEQVVNELHSPFLAPGEPLQMPVPGVSPPPPSRPVPPTPPTPPSKSPRVPPKPPPVKPKPGSKPWSVPASDRGEYEAEFAQLGSGYITRDVAWDHFRRYNVTEDEIAQIVHLASVRRESHLNSDEFVVAMHLLQNKLKGKAIPQELPPSLIPPSLRQSSSQPSTMDQPTPIPRGTVTHPPLRSELRPRSASQIARALSAFYLVTPSAEVLTPSIELQASPTTYSGSFDGVLYPPARHSIAVSPTTMTRRGTLSFAPTPEEDPLEELKAETKTLRRQIDNLLDQLGTQNELRKDNDALRNENTSLKAKVTELEANVTSVITQMQNSDNALAESLSTEIERLSQRLGELAQTEAQLAQTTQSLEGARRENAELSTQVRDLRRAEVEHKSEMEDAKHAMDDLEAENKDVKARLLDMTKAIQGTSDGKDGKESKNLSVKQLRVLLQDTNRENATLKERIRQVERSMEALLTSQDAAKSDELRRHNRELRMQVHELETLAAQLQSSQDDHHLRQVLEAVNRENESMKGKMRELQTSLTRQRGEHDNRTADLQRRLDELSRENEQLKMDMRNNRRSAQSANDVPPPAYDDNYIPPDVS